MMKKEQVAKAAKVYSGQLRREVNAEREALGKKPIEGDDDDNDPQNPTGGGTTERTVSTTDPDSGMFVKENTKDSLRMRLIPLSCRYCSYLHINTSKPQFSSNKNCGSLTLKGAAGRQLL